MAVSVRVLVGADKPKQYHKAEILAVWEVVVNGVVRHFIDIEEAFAHVKHIMDIELKRALNPRKQELEDSMGMSV
ncbi:hypothetical protein [Pseudomonas sp. NPDC089401]|uniref:hypothetical protein n=1 Tax=Pseudomonas sp. NPDC089401 TaxID=3364462 RepID=UPI00381BEFCD